MITGSCGIALVNLGQHVHAVLVGQSKVQQNEVERTFSRRAPVPRCRSRRSRRCSLRVQQGFQRLADFRFVINDQDATRRAFGSVVR